MENHNQNSMFYQLDQASLPEENKFSFMKGSLLSNSDHEFSPLTTRQASDSESQRETMRMTMENYMK
jgi:hypothetical protein